MRVTPVVLLAAVGVSAHPSGHNHYHRALHAKKDVLVTATIDGKVVSWTQGGSPWIVNQKPTSAASSSSTAATGVANVAAAVATASSSSSASVSATTSTSALESVVSDVSDAVESVIDGVLSVFEAFGDCSSSSKKRATAADIASVGNTGSCGYGSNILLVAESIVDKYDYKLKITNSFSSSAQCKVWNKIGPDGGINGFFTGNEAKTFTLAAGASQDLVFDSDSQGGMCCSEGTIPTTSAGEFLCPWIEFDFGSSRNSNWSGFDASALVEGSAGGPYNALKVCTADGSVCSSLDGSGSGTNAYLPGDEALDGIGGNLPAGAVSLVASFS